MRRGSACDNVRLHINGERAGFLEQRALILGERDWFAHAEERAVDRVGNDALKAMGPACIGGPLFPINNDTGSDDADTGL